MPCQVCQAAGLPQETVDSHFVRSEPGPNGVIVCPTLLAQECRYCHKNGHTPKYCPVLTEKKDRENRQDRETRQKLNEPDEDGWITNQKKYFDSQPKIVFDNTSKNQNPFDLLKNEEEKDTHFPEMVKQGGGEVVAKGCWGQGRGAEIVKQSVGGGGENIQEKRARIVGDLENARNIVASLEFDLKLHDAQMKKIASASEGVKAKRGVKQLQKKVNFCFDKDHDFTANCPPPPPPAWNLGELEGGNNADGAWSEC
jgi:hypothetical protein